jgi:hypothetical protein
MWFHLGSQRIRIRFDPVFAAAVGAKARESRDRAGDGSRRHNAALGFDNQRRERLGRAVDALDIDRVDKRLIFDRCLDNLTTAANAGIVNEGIKASALFHDHFDNDINLILFGHVEFHGRDVFDRVERCEILILTRAGVDVIAVLGQRFGEMSADASAGARYQDGLLVACNDGMWCHKKNEYRGCGNNKLQKLAHGVYLFL